jgi:hypothetical protein
MQIPSAAGGEASATTAAIPKSNNVASARIRILRYAATGTLSPGGPRNSQIKAMYVAFTRKNTSA